MVRRRQHAPEPREDPRRVEALRRLDAVAGAGDLDVAAYVRARAALTSGSPADVDLWLDRLGIASRSPAAAPAPAPPDAAPPSRHAPPPSRDVAPPSRVVAPSPPQPPVAPHALSAAPAAPAAPPRDAPPRAIPVVTPETGPFAPASGAVNLGPGRATANLPTVPIAATRPRWWRRLGSGRG